MIWDVIVDFRDSLAEKRYMTSCQSWLILGRRGKGMMILKIEEDLYQRICFTDQQLQNMLVKNLNDQLEVVHQVLGIHGM